MKGHIEEREGKTKTSFRYKLPNGRNSVTGKKDYYTSPCYATWEGADAAMKLHIATLTQERALKQIYSIYPSAHLVLPGARPGPSASGARHDNDCGGAGGQMAEVC